MTTPVRAARSVQIGRVLATATVLAIAAGCTIGSPTTATSGLDPHVSLSEGGAALAASVDWSGQPAYHVEATLEPTTGHVRGRWSATLPIAEEDEEIELVFLPLLAGVASDDLVEDVTVNGQEVDADVTRTVGTITIPLVTSGRTSVDIALTFAYRVDEVGDAPEPEPGVPVLTGASRLLLARSDDGLAMSHWLPAYDFAAVDATEVRRRGNLPAAQFSARLSVPAGYAVVTSGIRTQSLVDGNRLVVLEQSVGARDLAVVVSRDLATVTQQRGDTSINVHLPSADVEHAEAIARDAAVSLASLESAFGPYPWRELDLLSVPLDDQFGGVAWSGSVWIDSDVASVDGWTENDRRWAVAHELAHQWWGMQVRSDSHLEPILDEVIAQYAACAVYREAWPDDGDMECEAQTTGVYLAMRASGLPDGIAEKGYFSSADQQGGLVYGKAPHALLELGDEYGDDAVLAALAEFGQSHAFGFAGDRAVAEHLGEALGDQDHVLETWDRWMNEISGDEDLGYGG